MSRKKYYITAILFAVLITGLQFVWSHITIRSNESVFYVASEDLMPGQIIHEHHVRKVSAYTSEKIESLSLENLINKKSKTQIFEGEVILRSEVTDVNKESDLRYISIDVVYQNFYGGDFSNNDVADIFIIPDLSEMENYELKWLLNHLETLNVSFIPGKDSGILITDIPIEFIANPTSTSSMVVGVGVKPPMDQVISFLKTVGSFEFIRQ